MEWANFVAQKKNEGILFAAEIRVVGPYTDRLLSDFESSKLRAQTLNNKNALKTAFSLASSQIRSRNEEAINSTRNRIYSFRVSYFIDVNTQWKASDRVLSYCYQ